MVVDMPTRWASTYLMFKRLVELKEIVQDLAAREVHLTPHEWSEVERMASLLEIPYHATLNLQTEKLTPGDFLKTWREVIFSLEQLGGVLATDMAGALKRREEKLLENRFVLAAIWIDARYRVLLSQNQKTAAKAALIETHRIRLLSSPASSPNRPQASEEAASPSSPKKSRFDDFLDTLEENEKAASTVSASADTELVDAIESLGRMKKDSVWEIIDVYPKPIRAACHALSSIPTTQVSVERCFSHLRLLLRDNRAALKSDITEALLFLRTNKLV